MKLICVLLGIVALGSAAPFFATTPANFWAQLTDRTGDPTFTAHGLCNGYYGVPGSAGTNVGPKSPSYTRKLWVYCVHDIPAADTVLAAHLHYAGPITSQGSAPTGPVVYTFTTNAQNTAYSASGFQLGFDIVSESSERALFSGLYYVNVHTTTYPGGRIRGQFWPIGISPSIMSITSDPVEPNYIAYVDDSQEVPNSTTGVITKAAIYHIRRVGTAPSTTLSATSLWTNLEGTTPGTDPLTAAHFHLPNPPAPWPATNAVPLTPICSSQATCGGGGTAPAYYNIYTGLADANAADFDAGNVYVNYHTVAFAPGAVRGQVMKPVSMIQGRFFGDDQANFFARMDGSQAGTTATGYALLYYNPGSRELKIFAVQNSANMAVDTTKNQAHLHGPASVGHDGGVLCPLTAGTGNTYGFWWTASGSCILQPAWEYYLYNGLTYVNIHNGAFPNGEVRGQVYDMTNANAPTHAALLTDRQAGVSPSVASRGGIAFFTCGDPTVLTSTCTGGVMWAGLTSVPSQAHVHASTPTLALDPSALATPGNPNNLTPKDFICGGTAAACAGGNSAGPTSVFTGLTYTFNPITIGGVGTFDYAYVNVHTTMYGNGEVRGQIRKLSMPASGAVGRVDANADNANFYAIAAPQTGIAPAGQGGNGLCAATYNAGTATLAYTCVHTCGQASAAHFHGPCAPGTFTCPSMIQWTLTINAANTFVVQGSIPAITAAQWTNLQGGMYYFNVHTPGAPAGCATGTLYPAGMGASAATTPNYSAVLDGIQAGFGPIYGANVATGDPNLIVNAAGVFLLMASGTTWTSWQAWTGLGVVPNAAHIHGLLTQTRPPNTYFPELVTAQLQGLDVTTGANVTAMSTSSTGSIPAGPINTGLSNLNNYITYVNVHDSSRAQYANGIIRGLVSPLQVLPVGTPTPPPPSSSSSTGPTGSAASVSAGFLVVAILAIAAVLFQ
jgi:hypothetical protein